MVVAATANENGIPAGRREQSRPSWLERVASARFRGAGLIRVLLRLAPLAGPCKLLLGLGCRRLSVYVGGSRFRQAALPLHYTAFASPICRLGDIGTLSYVVGLCWDGHDEESRMEC